MVQCRWAMLEHVRQSDRHYDLLIEHAPGCAPDPTHPLRAWRLRAPLPNLSPGVAMLAWALPDHRAVYLDGAGPVSHGRGVVSKRDGGTACVHRAGTGQLICTCESMRDRLRYGLDLQLLTATRWKLCVCRCC